ncbi:MAG TPA: carboxypeptidase regulatory-like domain-containing protein [Bryobacteraceae bacterium]|nr:carboxypeptidase regulatory-like domain-containing protein [Bryobacteraceae bacterium]
MSKCLRVSLLATLVAGSLIAQDIRGRVQGTVSDSSGAVVTGAAVTLSNDGTGVRVDQTTQATGHYLFDFVIPGNYTVSVALPGFRTFVQKNILVQARGDVTVDATLQVGAARDAVTVEATPVAVEFNTSTMSNTVDTKLANTLPLISRNPFLFVALNPAVVLHSTTQQEPFHHWAASQFDVGGNTNDKNDILLDGSPSMVTQKSSYTPPMDAVEEVNLQQNSVDAEFGHSAGGVVAMQMKSGTNDFHGTAYYLGRNPALNALADRSTHTTNLTRQNTWGATLGNPIKRNRVFNFFAYEGMNISSPLSVINTLPTAAERTGDFSQALNTQGGLRTIYDPWSTKVNGSTVTRDPFPNNIIPSTRIDPTAKTIIGNLWQPNSPGVGPTGTNNFLKSYADPYHYWNLMDRVDYNISDRWKVFGRYNQFHTTEAADDYSDGSPDVPVSGSIRDALSISGDAVWTINPTTLFNIRGAYNSVNDSFGYAPGVLKPSDLAKLWPNNAWYEPYLANLPQIYFPAIAVSQGSGTNLGLSNYWYQTPNSYNVESKISKNIGRHYVKTGGEFRRDNVVAARPRFIAFSFSPALTANTFNSPNTALSGDGWASMLLGALDSSSYASTIPLQKPQTNFFGAFVQDDFKVNTRLTLNLGLRYEYYGPMKDPEHRLSRYLDLTSPIPELSGSNAPQLPAAVTALRSSAPIYNGAWVFTDSNNPGSWDSPKFLFEPRLGMALRINSETALRAGWARYIIPAGLTDGLNILGSVPYPGYDATSTAVGLLEGVPQQTLSNPFPGGLVPPTGKDYGRYTSLGTSATWYQQNFSPGVNDRFNVSVQRQLPAKLLADVTFFMNLGHNLPYSQDLNMVDPRIAYSVGNAVNQSVPNPFYNLLTPNQMPGQLRTQKSVSVSSLLGPYPQYGSLNQTLMSGVGDHYKSLQISVRRPYASGLTLTMGYNYNRETTQGYYDSVATYLHQFTWIPAQTARHRFTGAAVYELPFGKGRKFMSQANRIVDGVLGGWEVSSLFTYNSGIPLRLGSVVVTGDPAISNPTKGHWFDTSKVSVLPAFTERTNPVQYDDLLGPRYVNVDMTLAKQFAITERVRFELRGESYNTLNAFSAASPVTSVTSPNFGKVIGQAAGTYGRQIQFSGRIMF